MIRSKGEAGTGNIVEAVRHLRSILGDIRTITQADSAELYGWAKELAAPVGLVQEIAHDREAPRAAVLRRWHRHPRRRRVGHAARCGGRVRRVRASSSRRTPPAWPRRSSRRPHTSTTPSTWRRCRVASVRRCAGLECVAVRRASRRPGVVADSERGPGPLIGILDLQGDVREHAAALAEVGCTARLVKRPSDLEGVYGLVLPGGESTTLSMLLESTGLFGAVAERLGPGPADPGHLRRPRPRGAGGARRPRRPAHLRRARCGRPPQRLRPPAAVVRGRGALRLRRGATAPGRLHPGAAGGVGG